MTRRYCIQANHLTPEEKKERRRNYAEMLYKSDLRKMVVECKCPICDKRHKMQMTQQPIVMPRVYCRDHEFLRGRE